MFYLWSWKSLWNRFLWLYEKSGLLLPMIIPTQWLQSWLKGEASWRGVSCCKSDLGETNTQIFISLQFTNKFHDKDFPTPDMKTSTIYLWKHSNWVSVLSYKNFHETAMSLKIFLGLWVNTHRTTDFRRHHRFSAVGNPGHLQMMPDLQLQQNV